MAKRLGNEAKVAVSTDDNTYNDIGNITSGSFSISIDKADSTDADSSGAKEEVQTNEQMSLDVTARANPSDTGQAALIDEEDDKNQLYYRVRLKEAAGEPEWKFRGNLNDLGVSFPYSDIQEMTINVTSTGAITRSTQST